MARKHHHPRVHYGSATETACGLKRPRLGHGTTSEPGNVTCMGCLAVLARADAARAKEPDSHAAEQYGIALREHRRAVGD